MDSIDLYFRAEKLESLLFLGMGVVAMGTAAWLLSSHRSALTTGLALPLVLVGLIQLAVGGTVYARTNQQVSELQALYTSAPARFAAVEGPRMAQAQQHFQVYKLIEMAFVLVGTGLLYFRQHQDFWLGLGLGMLLQGTGMLAADLFAERRAAVYAGFVAQQR